MSTATLVPETYELDGDDAMETLTRVPTRVLVRDSLARMRAADGFSHSRATAFQVVLALIPAAIVLVAISAQFELESLSTALVASIESLAPGPTAEVFRQAFEQGRDAGDGSNVAALLGGAAALLISGTTVFGQIERTANRIYGIERDRTPIRKYAHAFVLMVTAGLMVSLYFFAIGIGGGWHIDSDVMRTMWNVVRWPLGALFLIGAFTIIFRFAPRRRQPTIPWLAVGALIGVGLTIVVSLLLNLYLASSSSFGDTYGPLAGFLGIMLWTYLSALALYFGLAFDAQLEAVRAGVTSPRSEEKVEASEPDSAVMSYATALAVSSPTTEQRASANGSHGHSSNGRSTKGTREQGR
jgi:YihY family inner membrane protein